MSSVIIIADPVLNGDRPLIKKLQQIQHFFSNQENYKGSVDYFLSHMHNNKTQQIVCMVITIQNILQADEHDPFSKLLTLRFIRQALITSTTASYAFITLLNSMLAPSILKQIATFRKEQNSDSRGQLLFGNYRGNKYDADYLRRIGVSVHKLALQMYIALAQAIPVCPYDTYTPSMPSQFQIVNKQLRAQNVKYPQSMTYYSNKQITKIKQSLNSNQSSTMTNIIHGFYRDLLQLMVSKTEQYYPYCVSIITDIVRTGDRYIVGQVLSYANRIMTKHQTQQQQYKLRVNKIFDIVDSIMRSGDIQIMTKVESELLIQLINAHQEGILTNAQIASIKKWIRFSQQCGHKGLAYAELNQYWSKFDYPVSKQQVQKYMTNCNKLQHNNQIKLANLNKNQAQIVKICEQIVNRKMEIKQQGIQFNGVKQDIHDEKLQVTVHRNSTNKQTIDSKSKQKQHKQGNRQKIIIIPIQNQYYQSCPVSVDLRKTPKSSIKPNFGNNSKQTSPYIQNIQFQTPKNKQQLKLGKSQRTNYHLGVGIDKDRVWEPRQLGRSHRKGSSAKSSMSNSRKKSQPSISQHFPINGKINNNTQSLQNQVLLYKQKQKQLQQELANKDQVIKKLNQINTASVLPMSFTQIQSSFSYQTPKRNDFTTPKTAKKLFILQSPYQSNMSNSVSQHTQQLYRWKKNLLKRKVLVFSNSHVEVGLITKNVNLGLQLQVFFTPFVNLNNVDIAIQSKCSWLKLINKNKYKEHKDKAYAQSQYIIKFSLATMLPATTCTQQQLSQFLLQYPQLQLSYQLRTGPISQSSSTNSQKQQPFVHQISLPISITKMSRSLVMQQKDWKICQQIVHSKQLLKFIDMDRRVCNNYDTFKKYFQHAQRMQAQPKTYICKLVSYGIQFYLILKIMTNNQAMIKIISTAKEETERNWLQVLLNAYSYAFSV